MKKILTAVAGATFCLGMFAFSPVTANDAVTNPEIDQVDLAVLGTCTEKYESRRHFTKCYKTYTPSIEAEEGIALRQQAATLANI